MTEKTVYLYTNENDPQRDSHKETLEVTLQVRKLRPR